MSRQDLVKRKSRQTLLLTLECKNPLLTVIAEAAAILGDYWHSQGGTMTTWPYLLVFP